MTATAVVTGLGVAAPNGLGVDDWWTATKAGTSGIRRLTRFDPTSYPARLAGEITDFVAAEHLPSRLLAQTDRMTQLALAATDWALADAALDPADVPEYQMSVVTASASGGFEFGQKELQELWSKGSQYVSAYQSFAWFYAVNTGQISIRQGVRGPSGVLVTDQAGGLDAVGQARRHVRAGLPAVLVGGVDASLCPWGWVAQVASGRLSTRTEPDRAYLPFDTDACGFVPGEGGAMLVVEEADAAAARGARVYGEIAGYAATFDPRPGSGRPPGLARAVRQALADAGLAPTEVDVVFADAAGLPDADRVEAEAITEVFGPYGVPVAVPKTMTGRLYSGGASLDLAAALLALREGVIPAAVHLTDPDPEHRLDLVRETRTTDLRTALVLARGHGGFNAAVVVRAPRTTTS
ncbi:ketosynthase chain-length factor [Micromonospora auratinigra]|uniref:Act minimal PKS chain-length factor (CLF/KS beta) n=1 Tax=Micromonospora auratinigra TaxID=261654 RepID=A0A1A8ZGA5_9ACTN|nr:ketosynthase chain-length factor [Micromonospora auratinigra]SBT42850.1 act minimal PKS chain-length factor (CLF/KS beta) [Micromonospora auratinigra]